MGERRGRAGAEFGALKKDESSDAGFGGFRKTNPVASQLLPSKEVLLKEE